MSVAPLCGVDVLRRAHVLTVTQVKCCQEVLEKKEIFMQVLVFFCFNIHQVTHIWLVVLGLN